MNTKEFIEQVISGELGKNDVLEYASHVKRDYNGDIQALADDLFLLAHGALLYGRTQAVSDWTEIERLEKAASVICDEYGLDWMEADSPTLQELETKQNDISKDLELVLNKLPGYIPGQIKPEDYYKWLQEITDRAETAALEAALAKGLSQEAAQALAADVVPLELEAESLAQSLAEITAEIEQARQQEAERAAAEPETEPEESEQETDYCPKKRNQQFKTWIKKRETFESINGYLVCKNYIDSSTTVDQWLWISGLSEDPQPKIKWTASEELFISFIQKLFWYKDKSQTDTQKSQWVKSLNTFELPKSEKGKQCTNLSLAQKKEDIEKGNIIGPDENCLKLLDKAIAEALKLEE